MKTKIRIGWMILTLVLLGMLAMTLPAMAQVTISASTNLTQANTNLYAGQTVTVTGSGTILTVETASVVGQLAEYQFGNLTVTNGAVILCRGQTNSPYAASQRGVALAVTGSLFIDATSSIHADGQGFAGVGSGNGRGPGAGAGGSNVGGGAGYSGAGGDARYDASKVEGGMPYGAAGSPLSLGSSGGASGGASATGGDGGGAIKLTIGGTLTVNGTLSANGGNGTASVSNYRAGGGGSGGSLWITSGVLQGSGIIRAVGGNAGTTGGSGGGGGGGRIDLSGITLAGSAFFTGGGTLNVAGGTPTADGETGGAGTIKFPAGFNLVIDNTGGTGLKNLTLGVNVESSAVDEALYNFPSLTVKANSSLTLSGNMQVTNGGTASNPYGQGVTISAGNIDVQSSGTITATGQGFDGSRGSSSGEGGWGPGGGGYYYGGSEHQGAGGGFGGAGGNTTNLSSGLNASGGTSYWGSASAASNQPTALGSGGGCSFGGGQGGNGGGGVKLVVSGNVTNNGSITADGANGSGTRASGGGSGGSIYIDAKTISGSGSISANGGNGLTGAGNATGGGGGGRVHIYAQYSLPANPTVNGGTGWKVNSTYAGAAGASGTLIMELKGLPPVISQGDSVTTNILEDAGTLVLTNLVSATDTDSTAAQLSWTNTTTPSIGTVVCTGTGTNPATFTYALPANYHGTNSFLVRVMDEGGRSDSITVTVVAAAINDAPQNTVAPGYDGATVFAIGTVWTVTNGVWNDYADTNAVYDGSGLAFAYQWYCSNNPSATSIANATNAAFTPGSEWLGSNLNVAVSCIDAGYPGAATTTVQTAWREVLPGANAAPEIFVNGVSASGVTTNINEDAGTVDLAGFGLTAVDDGIPAYGVAWTNVTMPQHGVAAVNGSGTNPAPWTSFSYTPAANWNGTDSFVVQARDNAGATDSLTVTVVVAAVNDPPTNTAPPGYTGKRLVGNVLTLTNGVWNDHADTNAAYDGGGLMIGYQWQRATNGLGNGSTNILNATNAAYTLTWEDKYKWVRAAVSCTDTGVPAPGVTTTVYTSWQQETSTVPTLVTFTNLLGNGLWNIAGNWAPADVPTPAMTAVIGDANVKSPVTAAIGSGDTAATAALTLGKNTGGSGRLDINGGTLAGGGNLVLGDESSSLSTGIVNLASGARMSGYPDVYVGRGAGSVGKIVVDGGSVFSNAPSVCVYIGAGQNSDGAVEVKNGTFWAAPAAGRTVKIAVGAGSAGRLTVTGGMLDTAAAGGTCVGFNTSGTGIVTVAGGTLNANALLVGYGDGGPAGQGSVYVTNNGTLNAGGIAMGWAAASNAYMLVDNSATVNSFGEYLGLRMGFLAGNVSMLDLKGGTTTLSCGNHVDTWGIGVVSGSTGIVSVTGGNHTWSSAHTDGCSLGFGAGAVGRLTIGGGSLSTLANFFVGRSGSGELTLLGGAMTNSAGLYLGYMAGGLGRMTVTGGTWSQVGTLGIGSAASGVTGSVTVANCVQTNITGAVTVGGGTTPGERYGSVIVSNATFGGTTAVTVWTNGFVELAGTGSVLRCSTFTCRGGMVTNQVQGISGGIDVTGATLVITNGGTMHLVFGQLPAAEGDFWGLRWAGNGHAGDLRGMTNSGALSWDDAALAGNVKIYTNATHTLVGYVSPASGATFRFR